MRIKAKILNWIVKDYLKLITSDEIVKVTKHGWFIANEKITPERARKISNEADVFRKSELWEWLQKDIHNLAYIKGMKQSTSLEDQYTSKVMEYMIEQINRRLNSLAEDTPPQRR